MFYTKDFKVLVMDELPRLKRLSKTVNISKTMLAQYQNNFYGLCEAMGISDRYHWSTLVINNLSNPLDYETDKLEFISPNMQELDKLDKYLRTK